MLEKFRIVFKSRSAITGLKFTGGNLIVALLGAIGTIIYGRWIEPDVLGEFQKYSILTGYLSVGVIFVDAAFQRHYIHYTGKGELTTAKEYAQTAHWWFLGLLALGVLMFSVLSTRSFLTGDINAGIGWAAQLFIFTPMTYGLYLKTLYRTNDEFVSMTRNNLVTAVIGFTLLPLIYFFQYAGLAARISIQHLSNVLLYIKYAPRKFGASFDPKRLIDMMKLSLPMQIPAYLDNKFFQNTVRLLIVSGLGETFLGLFSIALMLQSFLLVFGNSLNQIVTTKLMLHHGKSENIKETFKYVIRPVLLLSLFGLLMVLFFSGTIPFFFTYIMPKYKDATVVAQILSFELVFVLLRSPFSLFQASLMVKEVFILRIVKTILTILFVYVYSDSLSAIALAMVLSSFFHLILSYLLLYSKMRKLSYEDISS